MRSNIFVVIVFVFLMGFISGGIIKEIDMFGKFGGLNVGLGSPAAHLEIEKNIQIDKLQLSFAKDIAKLSIALDMICLDTGKSDKEYRDKALKSDAYIKELKKLQDRHDNYMLRARKYQYSLR